MSTNIPLNSLTWTPIGPAPDQAPAIPKANLNSEGFSGRITGIAPSLTDAKTIYVAAAGGGVWNTIDSGATWTALTDGQPNLQMGSIAIAPSDPNTIYAGTGESDNSADSYSGDGILKSSDAGKTWTLLPGNPGVDEFHRQSVIKIVVDPTNAGVVYAAVVNTGVDGLPGNEGIWKMTDGVHWTNTTAVSIPGSDTKDQFSDLAMDPADPRTLYAAIGNDGSSADNGVWSTTDGGGSWRRSGDFPTGAQDSNIGRITLAISSNASAANLLYATIAQNSPGQATFYKMFMTTNAGKNWTEITTSNLNFNKQGDYDTTLIIDPADSNTVFAGGAAGLGSLIETNDSGKTWFDAHIGPDGSFVHPDHHAEAFDAGGRLLDGNDGRIFRLEDPRKGHVAWSDLNTNLQVTQFYSVDIARSNPNVAIGGSQDNAGEVFNDNVQWSQIGFGDGGTAAIDPKNASVVFFSESSANGGTFSRSTDGGKTFSRADSGINVNSTDAENFTIPLVLDPTSPNRILFGTDRIYQTENAVSAVASGVTWSPISLPNTNGWNTNSAIVSIAIAPTAPNTVYATAGNQIMVTSNDGGSWQTFLVQDAIGNVLASDTITDVLVDPADSRTVYAVRGQFDDTTSHGHVFRSTDAGQTWSDISGDLPDVEAYAIAIDPNAGLFLGTAKGVYASTDQGKTWFSFTGMPHVRVSSLQLDTTHKILAAGTYGRGMWELSLTGITVSQPGSTLKVTGDAFGDHITLQLDPNDHTLTDVVSGATTIAQVPVGSFTAIDVNLGGGAANAPNNLTVNFINGNPIPSGGLSCEGSTAGADRLIIQGGDFQQETYSPSATRSGSGDLKLDQSDITFSGLGGIDDYLSQAGTLVYQGGAANSDFIALGDGESEGLVQTAHLYDLQGSATAATLNFANITHLVVNGNGGGDVVALDYTKLASGLKDITVDFIPDSGDAFISPAKELVPETTIFTVNSANDDGTGSLRQAIVDNNANPGPNNQIHFDIPQSGVHTIHVGFTTSAALPAVVGGGVTSPVTIDGTSQPGYAGKPLIELVDAGIPLSPAGLEIDGNFTTVKGLAVGGFSTGILLAGSHGLLVNNYIGVDATGKVALPNDTGVGISGSNNTVGGADLSDANLIAGNRADGADIFGSAASNNVLRNNAFAARIPKPIVTAAAQTSRAATGGTGISGFVLLGNGQNGVALTAGANVNTVGPGNFLSASGNDGLLMAGAGTEVNFVGGNSIESNGGNGIEIEISASNNTLGFGKPDVIMANVGHGVYLHDFNTSNNTVSGETIGVDAGLGKPNQGFGVAIGVGATNNSISNDTITGNLQYGVLLTDAGTSSNQITGNFIGTDAAGDVLGNQAGGVLIEGGAAGNSIGGTIAGQGNTIANNGSQATAGNAGVVVDGANGNPVLGNSIFSNAFLGIDNGGDGPSRDGPLLAPTAQSDAVKGITTVTGGLDTGEFNAAYTIEFFANTAADPTGFGQGQTFIGRETVTTSGAGHASFTFALPIVVPPGQFISATATDPQNNTSEFSQDALVRPIRHVINTADSGPGSLRQALTDANGDGGLATVEFDIPQTAAGIRIDAPGGDTIVKNVIGTNPTGTTAFASHVITSSFAGAGATASTPPGQPTPLGNQIGLEIAGSSNNLITNNLISGNLGDGIVVEGDAGNFATQNIISANFIGTDVTGTTSTDAGGNSLGNGGAGVDLISSASNNTIGGLDTASGGPLAGAGNLISGNVGSGIVINAGTNLIEGNYIGTDLTGTLALGNDLQGIASASDGNTVGGETAGLGNLVSGNLRNGITIGGVTEVNLVLGNLIGTDVTGTKRLGNGVNGIDLGGDTLGCVVGGTKPAARNVISANLFDGVRDAGLSNTIEGNYIGTDLTGSKPLGNDQLGIHIDGATGATIGGTAGTNPGGTLTGAGNLISNNGTGGVQDNAVTGTVIEGNYIGTDVTGSQAMGNAVSGVLLFEHGATLGGTTPAARNLISGNLGDGVFAGGGLGAPTGNTIEGNYIGTDVTGLLALGNTGDGVFIDGAVNSVIGGEETGAANTIAFNKHDGVEVNGASGPGTGNMISGNSIFSHPTLGIFLANNANDNQPAPTIDSVSADGGQLNVLGGIAAAANTNYTVELFANLALDPTGKAEGQVYLGSTTTTTGPGGDGSFSFSHAILPGDLVLSATATAPNGDTSAFSDPFVAITPTRLVFARQPIDTVAGQALNVTVNAEDPAGHVAVFDETDQVTLAVAGHSAFGTLTGTLRHGVITFSGLPITVPGSYKLTASSGNSDLTGDTSLGFLISPAATSQFAVARFPLRITAGVPGQFTVSAEDAFGNATPGYAGIVHFTSDDKQAALPADTLLTGGTGVFPTTLKTTGLRSINADDTSAPDTIKGSQSKIIVNPAAASQLAFEQQPTDAPNSRPIVPAVTVAIEDPFHNVLTSDDGSDQVTMSVASGQSGAALAGTTAQAVSHGIATFADLSLAELGAYTLSAVSGALAGATSASFNVSPGADIWTGNGPDDHWTDPANWQAKVAPSPNDDLTFPAGAKQIFNNNDDFPNGTPFHSLSFAAPYGVNGNSIALGGGGLTATSGETSFGVSGLTLTVDATFTASGIGTTLSMGTTVDNGGHQLTVAGDGNVTMIGAPGITGAGSLTKRGSGTLSLVFDNIYSGGTTIAGGVLSIGSGGALGQPATNLPAGVVLENGATLQLRDASFTVPANVSLEVQGTGSSNAGILESMGGNTWAGPVILNPSIPGEGLTVQIDHAELTISGVISEQGDRQGLTKTGSDTLVLSGANTYTGGTQIQSGELLVDGTQAAGDVMTVGNGGTLGGTGTVGSVNTHSGGEIRPGDFGSGTLTVATRMTLTSGSTFRVDFNGTAQRDNSQIHVTGGAVTLGAATLDLVLNGFVPQPGDTLTAIANDGGAQVSGTFVDANGHPLAEGAKFQVDGRTLAITYQGGASGHDVVVSVPNASRIHVPGTPNQQFVIDVFSHVLGRPAEPAGLAFWSGQLDHGLTRDQMVLDFQSGAESQRDLVESLYETYLHRTADAGGLTFFSALLAAGETADAVSADLVGSPEYFSVRGGGTDAGFLKALFHDALGRAIEPKSLQAFGQELAHGAPTAEVAAQVFGSNEHLTDVVANDYQNILNRPPDSGGLQFFLSQLAHGASDHEVIAAILASDEFFTKFASS